jgi:hypothetical protein
MTAALSLLALVVTSGWPIPPAALPCANVAKLVDEGDKLLGQAEPDVRAWLARALATKNCGDAGLDKALRVQIELLRLNKGKRERKPADPGPPASGHTPPAPPAPQPKPDLGPALHHAAESLRTWLPSLVAGGKRLGQASPAELRRLALLLGSYLRLAARPGAPTSAFDDLASLLEPVTGALSPGIRITTAAVAAASIEFTEEDLANLPEGLRNLIEQRRSREEIVSHLKSASYGPEGTQEVRRLEETTRIAEVRGLLRAVTSAGSTILVDVCALPEEPVFDAVPLREIVRQHALVELAHALPWQMRLLESDCSTSGETNDREGEVTLTFSLGADASSAPADRLAMSARLRNGRKRTPTVKVRRDLASPAEALKEQAAALIAAGLREIGFEAPGRDDAGAGLVAHVLTEPNCRVEKPHTIALAPMRLKYALLQGGRLDELNHALGKKLGEHLGVQILDDGSRSLPGELLVKSELRSGKQAPSQARPQNAAGVPDFPSLSVSLLSGAGGAPPAVLTVAVEERGAFPPVDAVAAEATLCLTRALALPKTLPPKISSTAADHAGWALLTPGLPYLMDSDPGTDRIGQWLSGIDLGLWLVAAGSGSWAAYDRYAYSVGARTSVDGTNALLAVAGGAAATALLLRAAVALRLVIEDKWR